MSASIEAGGIRRCPYCGSRNQAAHKYCVRCSAPLRVPGAAVPAPATTRSGNPRLKRFLLAAGVMAAIIAGLFLVTVSRAAREADAISEEVRADSARTIDAPAPAPPPPVSGWYPGGNVSVEPDTAPAWSGNSFPVARPNPYDVPGDPSTSMVGIAPSAPAVRAAMARKRVFTDEDLLATRGGAWTAHPVGGEVAERESRLSVAESRLQAAQARLAQARAQRGGAADDDHVREAIAQARDDVEDAREDAAKAQRKLQEARRDN
jgi:hypothetical protein